MEIGSVPAVETSMSYCALLLLGALSMCPSLLAQQAELKEPADSGAIFKSDARLVELHVTVTAEDGHLLNDLPESVFSVSENDAQQPIKVFRREDALVSLGLIIDNSASMRYKRTEVAATL